MHSHMDTFLSFALTKQKVWYLINPTYHDNFEYHWSGNAIVLTREKRDTPRVVITQERGDILYVPSWWLHKTKAKPSAKSFGVNMHCMPEGSVLGSVAHIFMRVLGDTTWFYSTRFASEKKNGTFGGAAM